MARSAQLNGYVKKSVCSADNAIIRPRPEVLLYGWLARQSPAKCAGFRQRGSSDRGGAGLHAWCDYHHHRYGIHVGGGCLFVDQRVELFDALFLVEGASVVLLELG